MTSGNRIHLVVGLLTLALGLGFPSAYAFHMGVTPSKVEETLAPGADKTIVYAFTNGSSTNNIRIQVLVADWTLSPRGDLATPKPGTYEYSASDWVEVSPAEFVCEPRQTQLVRVTYRVPKDAKPGDYLTSILFKQRAVVPPVKGRTTGQLMPTGLVGSLSYINVPPAEKKPTLEGMRFIPGEEQKLPRIELVLKNDGNTHVRPKGNLQVKDATGQTVYIRDIPDLAVVLRESMAIRECAIEKALAPGRYEAIVNLELDADVNKVERGKLNIDIKEVKRVAAQPGEAKEEGSRVAAPATTKPGTAKPATAVGAGSQVRPAQAPVPASGKQGR